MNRFDMQNSIKGAWAAVAISEKIHQKLTLQTVSVYC